MKKYFAIVLIMSSVVKASDYYHGAMTALTSAGKSVLSTLPTGMPKEITTTARLLTVGAIGCNCSLATSEHRMISAIPAFSGYPIAVYLTKDGTSLSVVLSSIALSSIIFGGGKTSITKVLDSGKERQRAQNNAQDARLRRSQFAALVGATASKALMDTDFFTNSVALLGFGAKGDIAAHIVGMTTSICASYKLAELVQAKFTQQENNNAN